MPKGVTKQKFNSIKKYYDPEIFCAAGKRIRAMARAADKLSVEERIERITDIFSTFRNPDKETVLTPWRVVNMHLGDCLGGYNFFEKDYETTLSDPRFIDRGEVTANVFAPDSRILEINSKSGLYPLYMAYSIYRARLKDSLFSVSSIEDEQRIWDKVVAENIFVICKTPMAKSITKRTLIGFRKAKVNTRYFEDLINQIKNKPDHFIKQVDKFITERTGIKNMKINAIVGNPPYQIMDGGAQASSIPVYQHFVSIAKKVQPNFISMIMPARWYAGGRGLDDFRADMLSDRTIRSLHDFPKASDLFNNVEIKGGLCYFLMDSKYDNSTNASNIVSHTETGIFASQRHLSQNSSDIFIRDGRSISIITKVTEQSCEYIQSFVSPLRPFGLRGYFINDANFHNTPDGLTNPVICIGKGLKKGYVEHSLISQHTNWIDRFKVIIPRANNIGTESNDDNLNAFIGNPNEICTESYLCVFADSDVSFDECSNICKYLKSRFARFMHCQAKSSQDATAKTFRFVPIQDFSNGSDIDWSLTSVQIDYQLYTKYGLSEDEISFIESMIKPM